MEQLLEETKLTYYEYVANIKKGCLEIAQQLRTEQFSNAFESITNLAEGLEWLIQIEQLMLQNQYNIKSKTKDAIPFFIEINEALENKDYILLADLFEYEIAEIFTSASEWTFEGAN
ncbi:hypothetical protein FOH38_13345 [Lysinibacillus fusiformis]|nr:hypothetical protein FOH38_13345 [Lysinibacillus fusiformis]